MLKEEFSTPCFSESSPQTFTRNRALQQEEPLLFEVGRMDVSGVDIEDVGVLPYRLGGMERSEGESLVLPGLSEPEAMRHYVRLSQKNYGIDTGMFPLGSCTMKHNPRLNEKMSRLPGFADIHPLQPISTVRGALELISLCGHWLKTLTGMAGVALSPKAGAHGEMLGLALIKAALTARGEEKKRRIVIVPESAHGTNPATAAALGFAIKTVPASEDGILDLDHVFPLITDQTAGMMLTNPNTCGFFERHARSIAERLHQVGAYFYWDGANFNALVGKVRPGDWGVDAMHINLHKTFSTPHGGGGPGAGPVVVSERLAPYIPPPWIDVSRETDVLLEHLPEGSEAVGRICAFHGQMGMFVRAMTFMLSHGGDGLKRVAEDAVLSANYIRAGLSDLLTLPFGNRSCMHEVLFDDTSFKNYGVSTLDIAKALIDEGYHPMTVYFPLIVHGAMLIEPTESESKASLDLFIAAMRDILLRIKRGDGATLKEAPFYAPRRRVDETQAARSPILRWSL
jgi:glycine dehydrogenase subunit 2